MGTIEEAREEPDGPQPGQDVHGKPKPSVKKAPSDLAHTATAHWLKTAEKDEARAFAAEAGATALLRAALLKLQSSDNAVEKDLASELDDVLRRVAGAESLGR
jgi:hypothetical protein